MLILCVMMALVCPVYGQAKREKRGWIKQTSGRVIYINKKGKRVTGKRLIKGKLYYFNRRGIRKSGWIKSRTGKKLYYGRKGSGRLYRNGQYVIGNRVYQFNRSGRCTQENIAVVRKDKSGKQYLLEPNYISDVRIKKNKLTEEDLFTALVYAEAGGQTSVGMQSVAMVCLNRVSSSHYPNDLRMMIYQKDRFSPAKKGTLNDILKDPDLHNKKNKYYEAARNAVRTAKETFSRYTKEKKNRVIDGFPFPEGKEDFDYVYFMTPEKFAQRNLDWNSCHAVLYRAAESKSSGHVFFSEWVEKK